MANSQAVAAERGANEVALAVLAITLVTVVVFFPVTLLFGVSKFLFTALALGVVLALFASYFVAVSVVPLYCAQLLEGHRTARRSRRTVGAVVGWPGSTRHSTPDSNVCSRCIRRWVQKALDRPREVVVGFLAVFVLCFGLYPLDRSLVLSSHRRRSICYQREGSHRHAYRADRKVCREG